ncbi:HAD-IIB family hydrolase [Halobacteriaceae archaeon SHR40]|uniref:HAD-IIB family hydrolase n=1 Tax=Halovenus amylolytica TaxID=2500550 RepID=UPI000FE3E56C
MAPPLFLDMDGTLTRPDDPDALDPRVFHELPYWKGPIVFATGNQFPYPVALCDFLGLPRRVIAENGGVVHVDGETSYDGDRDGAQSVIDEFRERGGSIGWDESPMNRWRETEIVVELSADGDLLREVASTYEMEVYDTGYAYHVKAPWVEKGRGLELVCEDLDIDPEDAVAVGDSVNDVSMFETAGRSFAVANADDSAIAAADFVTEGSHMNGTMEALYTV